MRRDDWLLNQLPMGMLEDDFFARFVGIFQNVATTMVDDVDNLDNVVDVTVAPASVARWMGSWIGVESIDSSLTHQLQRRIVRESAKILAWRGTKRGLIGFLELMSLGPVIVEESGGVYPEGQSPGSPPFVRIWVKPSSPGQRKRTDRRAHRRRLRRRALRRRRLGSRRGRSIGWVSEEDFVTLVRDELPAHVPFELFVGDRLVWPRLPELANHVDRFEVVDLDSPVDLEEVPV